MKKFSYLLSVITFSLIFMVSCSDESAQVEPASKNPTLASDYDVIVADAEIDQFVGDVTGLSTQEKMKLLSDFYANQYTQEAYVNGRTASTSLIACVSLVYDGSNFYARTRTGNADEFVSSVTKFRGPDFLAFISSSANIYSDGISIGGKAVAQQNFDCTGDDPIYAIAEARYGPNTSTGPVTNARISCGD